MAIKIDKEKKKERNESENKKFIELSKFIRSARVKELKSVYDLSEETNIHYNSIYGFERGKNIGINNLYYICDKLGIEIEFKYKGEKYNLL